MVEAAFALTHYVAPLWLVAIWLGSVRWAQLDARARLANPSGIRAATLLALLLPFAGVAVWIAFRPHETRRERRERRVVTLLLESQLPPGQPARSREAEAAAPAPSLVAKAAAA